MATGVQINRSNIELSQEVSAEIMQKTQEASAIMQLARKVALPGRGMQIPVIVSDPEAAWVSETGVKPVARPTLSKKVMQAYKLAVIVPFSDEFRRDIPSLYGELVRRLPAALAQKFDATVFGNGTAPGSNFDTFASCTAQSIAANATYAGLVAADTDVAVHGGSLNGWVISHYAKGILLAETDGDHRPLFINSVAEGAVPMILGSRTVLSKAAYKAGTPAVVGVAGDWTQAIYGTVQGVQVAISNEATLTDGQNTINLFQQNMFAVRAEIEVGFVADTSVFNRLTATVGG